MTATTLAYIAADLTALTLLVGALYAPRHSRKDLAAAYIGVNVGVLAVTLLLSTANVAAGLGLGLFGVLSIIRLRSTALSQHEVAYFFAALALGLLGGIQTAPLLMVTALMALVVASLWVADHPALMRRSRHQVITLDRAFTDETALTAHLEQLLGATVRSVEVERVDLVNDITQVDVRFLLPRGAGRPPASSAPQPSALAAPRPATSVPRPAPGTTPRPAAGAASLHEPASAARTLHPRYEAVPVSGQPHHYMDPAGTARGHLEAQHSTVAG